MERGTNEVGEGVLREGRWKLVGEQNIKINIKINCMGLLKE